MAKDCKHKVPCGCGDEALTTAPSCTQNNCPEPEPCPETFCDGCVVHCGDTIVDLGIYKGQRLDVILQQLALMITAPFCAGTDPAADCSAILGLASSTIGSSSIGISWIPNANAIQYQVEYKQASSMSWTIGSIIVPVGGETIITDTVGGLIADTDYHIRVLTTCTPTDACYSVTILVRTKP